jgi:pimeloyl-ACP methyl ester carboxylesterase
MRIRHRLAAGFTATAMAGTMVAGTAIAAQNLYPATPRTSAGISAGDTTTTIEQTRVDRVPTPQFDWFPCFESGECATVKLPRDYDEPDGPTTEIAVARVKARDPAKRIGALFVNPGGPGGAGVGTLTAVDLADALSKDMRDRFDVVGFDPRGVGFSDPVQCFPSIKDQFKALTGLQVTFPMTAKEESRYISSAQKLATACSTTGQPLTGSASTAEAARDMDVLRRAVGDPKLTYLGFSYGTALGQYYANMFPDRVRAIAIDGVIDPTSWVGTDRTAATIQDDRLHSADGAYKALHEILVRCRKAGKKTCHFARFGDPVKNLATLAARLKRHPATIEKTKTTYADLVGGLLGSLYEPDGYVDVDEILSELYQITAPRHQVSATQAATATQALARRISSHRADVRQAHSGRLITLGRKAFRRGFRYSNDLDSFSTVTCTDGRHPALAQDWPTLTAAADRRAPYFGRVWAWGSVQCAGNSWTVRDEDAFTGPFNRRTSAPVLFVGNYYDPATNYNQAVSASKQLPNSRLLSSNSWGHKAYGTSDCVTTAVDRYLLAGRLPAKSKVCIGDVQPFQHPRTASARRIRPPADAFTPAAQAGGATSGMPLSPVAIRVPPSTLLGTR